ncbi:MAG: alpha/beta fold hydrolase [Myxococcota bacterium]
MRRIAALIVYGLSVACSGPMSNTSAEPNTREPEAEREVSFASDGMTLEGTLYVPASNGSVPVIVLVHGSGPHSRRYSLTGQLNVNFGFELDVFDELAKSLHAAGFAVLTYDKRTCGRFNNCAENAYPEPSEGTSLQEFAGDVMAAVAFLRTQDGLGSIHVVGHSQGAELALWALSENNTDIASAVLLAVPFEPVDVILEDQLQSTRDLLNRAGTEPSQIQALTRPTDSIVQGLANLRDDSSSNIAVGGASAEFWRSWMAIGESRESQLAAVERPLLIVHGTADTTINEKQSELWRQASTEHSEVSTVRLSCISHALNCLEKSDPLELSLGDISRHVDSQIVEAITSFFRSTKTMPPGVRR